MGLSAAFGCFPNRPDTKPIIPCIELIVIVDPDCALPPRKSLIKPAIEAAPTNSSIGQGRLASRRVHCDGEPTLITTCCLRNSGINPASPKSGTRLRKVSRAAAVLRRCRIHGMLKGAIDVRALESNTRDIAGFELVEERAVGRQFQFLGLFEHHHRQHRQD